MIMKRDIFASATRKYLPPDQNSWTSGHLDLLMLAEDIDRCRGYLTADAETLARDFAQYAAEAAEGALWSPPNCLNKVLDLASNHTKMIAMRDSFRVLRKALLDKQSSDQLGKDVSKELES